MSYCTQNITQRSTLRVSIFKVSPGGIFPRPPSNLRIKYNFSNIEKLHWVSVTHQHALYVYHDKYDTKIQEAQSMLEIHFLGKFVKFSLGGDPLIPFDILDSSTF